MAFKPRDKKVEPGPVLKRDEHGNLDQADADRVLEQLTRKLITEERSYQKEISFKNAKGAKRDIMLFVTICQRNSIDGKIVLGDESNGFEPWSARDMYKYKVFDYVECEMLAREFPMAMHTGGKYLMGMMKAISNYLARMGVFNRV